MNGKINQKLTVQYCTVYSIKYSPLKKAAEGFEVEAAGRVEVETAGGVWVEAMSVIWRVRKLDRDLMYLLLHLILKLVFQIIY